MTIWEVLSVCVWTTGGGYDAGKGDGPGGADGMERAG